MLIVVSSFVRRQMQPGKWPGNEAIELLHCYTVLCSDLLRDTLDWLALYIPLLGEWAGGDREAGVVSQIQVAEQKTNNYHREVFNL